MSSFYESPQCHIYLCQICESNSHYGYEYSQRVPLVYEPEPCYIQNFSDNNSSHYLPSLHPLIDHHCFYECGNSLNDFFCYQCTCKFCGNGAHVGYNCPAQVLSVQTLPSFPQQYPCCEDYGVTHEPYQCQPKNHVQASCFDSNSFGFDQSQPKQYTVDHPIFNAHNSYLDSQIQLNSTLAKIKDQMTSITSLCEMACQVSQKKLKEKQIEEERAPKAKYWKLPVCYNDDDDEERSDSLNEFIKSGVENLIPILSESEGIPEHMCDVPFHDNSPPLDVSKEQIEDFSESNEEFFSTDDDSFSFDKIDYVEASPPDSELVSSEVMEIVIPEVGGIEASNDNHIPFYELIISGTPPNLTPSGESDFFLEGDMLLFEAFLNDDHSFDFKTRSSSTSLNSLLEETNNFDNSLPEFTTFSKSKEEHEVHLRLVLELLKNEKLHAKFSNCKENVVADALSRKDRVKPRHGQIDKSSLIGPELVQESIDMVVLIKEKLKAARDCQKSYADNRRKPLEFDVGDRVLLKVSP
nr:reverse transcriptase domain-containing protein [Tanacetum cinerariifolium]